MAELETHRKPELSPKEKGLFGVRGILKLPHPVDENGKPICRWCYGDLPPRRTSWCSNRCFEEYKKSGGDWRLTKQAAFRRDNGKCRHCGIRNQDADLEVDHILPVIEGGDDRPSNLRLLCQSCHKKETASLRDRMKARA